MILSAPAPRQFPNLPIKLYEMPEVLFRRFHEARERSHNRPGLNTIMTNSGCIACARKRMASAFSMLSVRLSE